MDVVVTPSPAVTNVVVTESSVNVDITPALVAVSVTQNQGPMGPPGPPGPSGALASQNFFVQSTAPSTLQTTYAWVQTGLGNSGHDTTIWVQDGL